MSTIKIGKVNKESSNTPINQILYNGEHINQIKYGDKAFQLLSPDRIVTKDFLDSSGLYTQLRIVQVAPNIDGATEDEERTNNKNTLFFFAQNNPSLILDIYKKPNFENRKLIWDVNYKDNLIYSGQNIPQNLWIDDQINQFYTETIENYVEEFNAHAISSITFNYIDSDDQSVTKILTYSGFLQVDTYYKEVDIKSVEDIPKQGFQISLTINGVINNFYLTDLNENEGTFFAEDNTEINYTINYSEKEYTIKKQPYYYYYNFTDTNEENVKILNRIEELYSVQIIEETEDIENDETIVNITNISKYSPAISINTYKSEDSFVLGPKYQDFDIEDFSLDVPRAIFKDCFDIEEEDKNIVFGFAFMDEDDILFLPITEELNNGIINHCEARWGAADDLRYIGSLDVEKNFELSAVQALIDDLYSQGYSDLKEYSGELYNDIFSFSYDTFDGSGCNQVTFGAQEQGNVIQPANKKYKTGVITSTSSEYENNAAQLIHLDGETYYCYQDLEEQTIYHMFNISNINETYVLEDGQLITLPSRNYNISIVDNVITFAAVNCDLCMVDVVNQKPNTLSSDEVDIWSLLYIPYLSNNQLEFLFCAILKSTSVKIDSSINPKVTVGINPNSLNYNRFINSYTKECLNSNFFAAKSGISYYPQIISYSMNEEVQEENREFSLNSSTIGEDSLIKYVSIGSLENNEEQEIIQENTTENDKNILTWPLKNKKFGEVLKLSNCYFSLNNKDWYGISSNVNYNTANDNFSIFSEEEQRIIPVLETWIDLSKIYKKQIVDLSKDTRDYCTLKITDKDDTGQNNLDNNGNILLKADNIISIIIINNPKEKRENVENAIYIRVYREE